MSNNPFIEQTPAHARYPDISSGSSLPATPQSGQLPQQTGFGFQPSPYNQGLYGGQNYQQPQQQQQQYQSLPQPQSFSQPQYTGSPYGGTPGYQTPMMTGAPRSGFQPTSSFGQQLSAQVNGNYGYSQQAQPQQYGGYGQQSSMQPPNWSAVAQFDPYAQLGNALDSAPGSGAGLFGGNGPASPMGMHQRGPSFSGPVTGQAPQAGQLHPRELVRAHKFELEKWDPYAWKQLMNSFDALRGAWEARKRDAQNRMAALGQTINYDYGAAQEYGRLQGVSKDAENNHDTVAASAFQVLEVQGSYRQSGDTASKRRVRESLNASLNALPDWPPQQW